ERVGSRRIFQLCCRKMLGINSIDDLEVPRENAPEQIDWPGFERFRQKRMVGVGESADRDPPRFVPRQAGKVDKNAHKFRNCDTRMRVIEFDRGSKGGEGSEGWRGPAGGVEQGPAGRPKKGIFLGEGEALGGLGPNGWDRGSWKSLRRAPVPIPRRRDHPC